MVNALRAHGTRSAWVVGVSAAVAVAAFIMAAPATAGPSSTTPGALAVTASALPAEILPGETTALVVTVSNVGGSSVTGVTLSESLPAALTYLPESAVVVRGSAAGFGSANSDVTRGGSATASQLGAYSPGQFISASDGVDLAPGESVRVTFSVTVNPALAPGVDTLTATSIAASGAATVASDTVTLTVLKQALSWAYGDGSN